jgi:ribosomal protein S18 acetylase RimI-like enzyme
MKLAGRAAGIVVDEDRSRIDFARVHEWLSCTYWSPGVAREKVERAAQHSSLVIGAYDTEQEGRQVGYVRIVSDRATFAYLCDVYVDEDYRGRGIARAMVRYALEHPEHQGLRRWMLATRDAHDVYRGLGFDSLPSPERWMTLLPESRA